MVSPRTAARARPGSPIHSTVAGDAHGTAASTAPDEQALYVYAIIRASRPPRLEVAGIDARWPVQTIHHQDMAAVVSRVPAASLDPTRANLLAHERVTGDVMREHTVIPMSFGTVFRSRDDVIELLRSTYDTFADVLDKLHDKVEFGLKAFWDREEAMKALEAEDPEIRRLKQEILAHPNSAFVSKLQYGSLVDTALTRRAERYTAEFMQRLRDACVASRCNAVVGDKMIMNAAFLVQRSREGNFEQHVKAIADEFPSLTFKFSGPWPPYNFVAIRLKRGGD